MRKPEHGANPTPRARQVYEAIRKNPGVNYTDLAKAIDVPRASMDGYLATCERAGLLVSEDRQGRLWVFEEAEQ